MKYEDLLMEAEQENISVAEKTFKSRAKGLCKGNRIGISQNIETTVEKACVLAEELGHYHTTVGDILEQDNIANAKQEHRARVWAYRKMIPFEALMRAMVSEQGRLDEVAEHLGVDEQFLRNV
ncbi:ImmA/IrrE family metallo-endopeptidase [Bacillota bacterium]